MSIVFSLFLLHESADIHPRSWICVSGKKLPKIVENLEKEILKSKELTREELSRTMGGYLRCSHTSFKQLFQKKRPFFPIPFLIELAEIAEDKKILNKINSNIESLKVNSASAAKVKACKKLDYNLAKIIGAFMADGSLSIQVVFSAREKKKLNPVKKKLLESKQTFSANYSKTRKEHYISINKNKSNESLVDTLLKEGKTNTQCHYTIELCDAYKDNVLFFKNLIKNVFGISPNKFYKKGEMWRVIFSNKILARFLIEFFGIWPGKKSDDAFEPEIIKKAPLKTRKAFVLGLLTFDGCVTKQGKMCLSSNSKSLVEAVEQIWKKDKIQCGISKGKGKNRVINAYLANSKKKLIQYFEPDTQKWKLIRWLEGRPTKKPIIKETGNTKISEAKILRLLRKEKNCDIVYLTRLFSCRQTTARYYLKTLKKQNKITLSNRVKMINPKNVSEKTTVSLNKKTHGKLFEKIKKKFAYDNAFADTLEIKKATLSAWKKRKNRIPLQHLEKMCKILGLNFQRFCSNLVREDREIAVIK